MSGIQNKTPPNWSTRSLSDLVDFKNGINFKKDDKGEIGIQTVDVRNMYPAGITLETDDLYHVNKEVAPDYVMEPGDVLIVRSSVKREGVGWPVLFRGAAEPTTYCGFVIRARPQDSEISSEFLTYFLRSPSARREVVDGSSQVTITNVNQKTLGRLSVPLPPLPEQRRIVARIEELFSRLDAGVAALRHAKAQLQRYRQSVLAAAVTGQLTQAWREQHPDTEPAEELLERILEQRREQWSGKRKYKEPKEPAIDSLPALPSSWTWISPDQLSAQEDYSLAIGPFGSNLKVADYTDSGVPLVFVRHIRANDYDISPKFVSEEKANELKAHSVDPGDLLITKMGEPPGDAALYPDSRPHAIITADCIKLRLPAMGLPRLFFVNAINSKLVADQITPRTRGVAQKKISLDRFRDVALPLPPLAEQHQIFEEVEARVTTIDNLEAELDRQITRSNRLRQSTLAAAFSGRI